MSVFYDYGEFLICILPPFLIIAAIGLMLLANSRPAKRPEEFEEEANDK